GAKLLVGAPPGAPLVPEGFEPAGIATSSPSAGATGTIAAPPKKGGSTALIVIGVAAAVGGGVALAAKGGGSESGSGSSQPVTASITSVSPTGTALVSATVVAFSASVGGATSVSWDFGDGTSGSGASVTHVYDKEGTFQVVLRASGGT